MPVLLDLNLLPVARYAGQEYPDLLGLYVTEPPRRTARGRAADRLVLYLAMSGNAPLAPAKQNQLLENLAKLYYATSGTATSALRAVAEQLNDLLWKRNLRNVNSGHQGVGVLVQAVLRENQLFLALCGPAHAYLIAENETQYYYDAEMDSQALGQGRLVPIVYHPASLQANDTLLLAAQPPADWDVTTMNGLHGQGPESLRRRLFANAAGDLNAVLIQARPGKGKSFVLRQKTASGEAPPVVSLPGDEQVAEISLPAAAAEAITGAGLLATSVEPEAPVLDAAVEPPGEAIPPGPAAETVEQTQKQRAPARLNLAPLWKVLVAIGTPLALLGQRLGQLLRTVFGRMLPVDPFQSIPNSLMAFVAVMVPVVIVTVASTVYFELGRDAQYEILYAQAQKMAAQAAGQTDLLARRSEWEATLALLQQVEAYKSTSDTQALYAQAQVALDELDLVRRLDYRLAVSGLPLSVNITRMVVSDVDMYLLDSNSGNVFHAQLTGHGYDIDPSFECGPNVSGILLAGPIVDIVAWPAGFTPEASLLAMDMGGNAIYCQPNALPQVEAMTPPPNTLMENLRGFALDLGDLYILDPFSNAVWVYLKSELGVQPSLYFDEEIPFMQDVDDLAANSSEVYLLHTDGRMTLCFSTGLITAPTRCNDQRYIDSRPGRENTPLIEQSPFTQVQASEPPDPSLFLLESSGQAIYHFSLRNLVFQRKYLPQNPLSTQSATAQPATAFAVNPLRRLIFLAVGSQVYYANLP